MLNITHRCVWVISKLQSNILSLNKQLGQLEGITMDFGESDEKSRENLIKSHYTTRLAQLTAQRQVVDGKVVNFSSEVSGPLLFTLVSGLTKSFFKAQFISHARVSTKRIFTSHGCFRSEYSAGVQYILTIFANL